MKLSVIIPAFNEEKNLNPTVYGLMDAFKKIGFDSYEILIFDDKSTDKTGVIADGLAREFDKVRVVHNETNRGLGYNYKTGVMMAAGEYVLMIPGDNETDLDSINKMIESIGGADIVMTYTVNMDIRSMFRRFVSRFFVGILNLLFNLRLRYYNGICIHRTDFAKKALPSTFGFAYAAEMVIRLIKSGAGYIEVPIKIKPTSKTTAFKFKNIVSVLKTLLFLVWSVDVKRERIKL